MPNEIKTDFDPRIMDESKFLNSPNKLPNIWVTLIKTNQQRLGDLSSNVWSHEFCGKTMSMGKTVIYRHRLCTVQQKVISYQCDQMA